jgi:hypothetical protein
MSNLAFGIGVSVPEAAMDKDHLSASSEYQIRLSREITFVEPESVAKPVSKTADQHLWLRIFRPDSTHISASRLGRPNWVQRVKPRFASPFRHLLGQNLWMPWRS